MIDFQSFLAYLCDFARDHSNTREACMKDMGKTGSLFNTAQ